MMGMPQCFPCRGPVPWGLQVQARHGITSPDITAVCSPVFRSAAKASVSGCFPDGDFHAFGIDVVYLGTEAGTAVRRG